MKNTDETPMRTLKFSHQ